MKASRNRRTHGISAGGAAARLGLALAVLFMVATVAAAQVNLDDCGYAGENCTAKELTLSGINIIADSGSENTTCENTTDTVDVILSEVLSTSATRYDVGVGMNTGLGTSSECWGESLTTGNTNPDATQENSNGGSNQCLDISQTSLTYTGHYTVQCRDTNQDCLLDVIDVFAVWAQNSSSNPDCSGANGPFVGTTAKCKALLSPVPAIPVGNDCGNGALECNEQCDNGEDNNDNASCTSECQNATCGDGLLWNTDGGTEECDLGGDNSDTGYCTTACNIAYCGDGFVFAGDESHPEIPAEQCDDGNNSDNDNCLNDCTLNVCGDGIVNTGVEQCDDGKDNNDLEGPCTTNCTLLAPTMPEWGLGFLALLLGGTGAAILRRKIRVS